MPISPRTRQRLDSLESMLSQQVNLEQDDFYQAILSRAGVPRDVRLDFTPNGIVLQTPASGTGIQVSASGDTLPNANRPEAPARRREIRLVTGIQSYNCNPMELLPYKPVETRLVFGVELEVKVVGLDESAAATEFIRKTTGENQTILAKFDRSIGGGFEAVSVPMELEEHIEAWRGGLAFLRNNPNSFQTWNSGTCGMHVHINRRACTTQIIRRMNYFINAPGNLEVIAFVAGRNGNSYCRRIPKPLTSPVRDTEHDERYQGFNTTNPNTVEIRIFRACSDERRFTANLEFCKALYYFCGENHTAKRLCVKRFKAFVDNSAASYPYLAELLSSADVSLFEKAQFIKLQNEEL